MIRRLLIVVPVVLAAMSAQAQQVLPQHTETITVRIANIDVVVTDKAGKVVTGLTQNDFELLENKVPQAIVNFYEAAPPNAATPAPRAATAASTPAPAVELAPKTPPRHIILYIDNATLGAKERDRILVQMKKLLPQLMRPGDEAMVATFQRTAKVRVAFTDDQQKILDALDRIAAESSGGDTLRRQAIGVQQEIHAAGIFQQRLMLAKAYAASQQNDLKQSIASVNALMTGLAGVEGKKALVMASEGFPIHPGREMFEFIDRINIDRSERDMANTSITDRMSGDAAAPRNPGNVNAPASQQSIARMQAKRDLSPAKSAMMSAQEFDSQKMIETITSTANANGVTLYPLQGGAFNESGDSDVEHGRQGVISSTFVAQRVNTASAMKVMAEQTGGVMTGGSTFDDLFDRIRSDLDSYYSLGYKPAVNGERSIQVRVKKPGRYIVRARRSYVHKTIEEEISDRVIANLLTKPRAGDAKVRITAEESQKDAEGKVIVPVKIHVPFDSLTLIEQEAAHAGGFDVYLVAADSQGAMSPVIHKLQKVTIPAAAIGQTKGKTYTYALKFRMNADVQSVSVAVVDAVTQTASFARYEVPIAE